MYKKYRTLTLSLFSATLLLSACSISSSQEPINTAKAASVVEVVSPINDQPLYNISLPGELKPYEQVNIYAKVKGFVKQVYVDRGSYVKKGQLLALLEAPEISLQQLSSKSNENKFQQDYLYAEQSYERLKNAAKTKGAVAGIELDRALRNLNHAKAALDASKAETSIPEQLNRYLRITAPFDGMITEKNVSEGALVGDNQNPLFNLVQNKKLRLTVSIPEKHAKSTHKGMDVHFSINAFPGKKFTAQLSRTSSLIQQNGRAMAVEFDVDNSNEQLNGGEYAQVQMQLMRQENTLWVPASSVVRSQSGTFIWKLDENQSLQKIHVIEGSRIDSLQEVFGLIDEKDKIVKIGTEEMKEDSKVEIAFEQKG